MAILNLETHFYFLLYCYLIIILFLQNISTPDTEIIMIKTVINCDTLRFFLPCSARENNKVIKYIVYTNIRYWHISDNNRPWLSPAIIISTGPGRIN